MYLILSLNTELVVKPHHKAFYVLLAITEDQITTVLLVNNSTSTTIDRNHFSWFVFLLLYLLWMTDVSLWPDGCNILGKSRFISQ